MINYNTARDEEAILELRPELYLEKMDTMTEVENFQNSTLRPILKMQHNLLLDFLLQQKNIDSILANRDSKKVFEAQLKSFINQAHLKEIFIGMILGLFSREEMKLCFNHSKEINKRIMQMILQRFMDSL